RLHLFADSGPLGIQPLSRGIDKIIFLHQNFKPLNLIKPNLNQLHLMSQPQLYKNNPHTPLKPLPKPQIQFHLIFLHPPYNKPLINHPISPIPHFNLLKQNRIILC
ncbi:RsmD family RNA methyltransferase, partial [Staphylococcus epidermidis]|uniref:RsmD family RNA methyltransferase n=1 Tax=Staphylococcus epidermidis TaxID=1282 RepID=UPI001643488B